MRFRLHVLRVLGFGADTFFTFLFHVTPGLPCRAPLVWRGGLAAGGATPKGLRPVNRGFNTESKLCARMAANRVPVGVLDLCLVRVRSNGRCVSADMRVTDADAARDARHAVGLPTTCASATRDWATPLRLLPSGGAGRSRASCRQAALEASRLGLHCPAPAPAPSRRPMNEECALEIALRGVSAMSSAPCVPGTSTSPRRRRNHKGLLK